MIESPLETIRISTMQHLKLGDIESHFMFAKWIKNNNTETVQNIWFSGEAHFYLNGIENKRNGCYWGTEKPNLYIEKPVHGEKVTV